MPNQKKRCANVPLVIIASIALLVALFLLLKGKLLAAPCFVYEQTGLQCPGCGGTRAVNEITQGNLRSAFHYNSLITAIIVVISLTTIYAIIYQLITSRPAFSNIKKWINIRSGLGAIAIVTVFTLVRNMMA